MTALAGREGAGRAFQEGAARRQRVRRGAKAKAVTNIRNTVCPKVAGGQEHTSQLAKENRPRSSIRKWKEKQRTKKRVRT